MLMKLVAGFGLLACTMCEDTGSNLQVRGNTVAWPVTGGGGGGSTYISQASTCIAEVTMYLISYCNPYHLHIYHGLLF